MPKQYDIFINYRREDTQPMAVVLELLLRNAFDDDLRIFLDKEEIKAEKWPEKIQQALQSSSIVLTLIGNKWLSVKNEFEERRIDVADDWVRSEIEMAIDQDKIVIPLLVENASVPKKDALHRWPKLQEWLSWNAEKVAWDTLLHDIDQLAGIISEKLNKPLAKRGAGAATVHPLDLYPLPAGIDPFAPDEEDIDGAADKIHAPYLGLRYFRRKDAPLFFGRTPEILEFFSLVKNPDVRIIRLYGESGVGKSSFLAAGVLPRLELFRQPHYVRRNKVAGLGAQLTQLLEKPKGLLPPVYILDQTEEMFTDKIPGEPEAFLKILSEALHKEPQATFVLGFRSDYLLDLSDLLRGIHYQYLQEDLILRPLSQAALTEAVQGVWQNALLQKACQIDLEPGFADYVARDLIQNESGSAASILQNRLLKLYENAYATRSPLASLRISEYEALKQNASAEEDLLDYQLQRLHNDTNGYFGDKKLLLNALNEFVIDKPTAGSRTWDHAGPTGRELYEALLRVDLLAELREPIHALRLSHDLLAPVIRRRYDAALQAENKDLQRLPMLLVLLEQSSNNISEFNLMAAKQNLDEAFKLNLRPDLIMPNVFELAYVYFKAYQKEEGWYFLDGYENLAKHSKISKPFRDRAVLMGVENKDELEYLRSYDPDLYNRLEQRYFPTMCHIEGGTFEMGDVMGDNERHDEAVHIASVGSFELADTPITWHQYGLFCLANGKELHHDEGWGRAERPIINVSWQDAIAYANWLSLKKSLDAAISIEKNDKYTLLMQANGFRLPTEAEWEYAAREGGKSVRFGNGQNSADSSEINFDARGDNKKDYSNTGEYRARSTPIRQFKYNALGLYDMSGNVSEWCWDWYAAYPDIAPVNYAGPDTGAARVLRGGSWSAYPVNCRVASRFIRYADIHYNFIGFRLARTL